MESAGFQLATQLIEVAPIATYDFSHAVVAGFIDALDRFNGKGSLQGLGFSKLVPNCTFCVRMASEIATFCFGESRGPIAQTA